jgi:methyl-accepting chemotaxis protein
VIADWRPVHVVDETWALFCTMAESEALAGVAAIEATTAAAGRRLLTWQLGIGLVLLVAVPALASQLGRRLSRPIVDTAEALERTAAGDLGASLEVSGHDELATMAEALNGTLGALRETFGSDRVHWPDLAESQAANERLKAMVEQSPACMVQAGADGRVLWMNGASERAAAAVGLAGRTLGEFFGPDVPTHELRDGARLPRAFAFERGAEHLAVEVSAIRDGSGRMTGLLAIWEVRTEEARVRELFSRTARQLVETAAQLESASRTLLESADATAERTQLAASESAEVSSGQTQISAATEQMTSSIASILDTTRDLAEATRRAVSSASSATHLVEVLRQANGRISTVTETIAGIADQTNLLALNATIEAAGAGDAGRGFAVVASEVKDLARETMQATHAIDEQVGDISGRSEDVAAAFQQIADVIAGLDELAAVVTQSVTEQRSATGEIAASVGDNATRSERITAELDGVREAVEGVRATARELLGAVDQLGGLARTLEETATGG